MLKNFGALDKYQWYRLGLNTVIYFFGTLFGLLGFEGLQTGSVNVVDISVTTFVSALSVAGGSTLKFLWTLLFEPVDKKGK